MIDSKTGYFQLCLALLVYFFFLAYGCAYLVSIFVCVDCKGVCFAPIYLQKTSICSCVK